MSDEKKPGPTGKYPKGMLSPDDKGELRVALSVQGGNLVMQFGTPVTWMAIPPTEAVKLAAELFKKAALAGGDVIDVDIRTKDDVDPKLTVAILQGYLRAVMAMPLPIPFHKETGQLRFSDFLREEDHKLHWAILAAVGEAN